MLLPALLTTAGLDKVLRLCHSDEPTEITACLPTRIGNHAVAHALYIGPFSEMPPPLPSVAYLCIGDLPEESALLPYLGCDVVHCSGTLDEVFWAIAQTLASSHWLNVARGRLIDIMTTGGGLQRLVDEAYAILGTPMVLVDTSYKLLASNKVLGKIRPDLAEQYALGYMLDENVQDMQRLGLYERAREIHYPYYSMDSRRNTGWITALVYSDGIEVAQLGVMEYGRAFTHDDFEFVDFLCRMLGVELSKSDLYTHNIGINHSLFLNDLLQNVIGNEAIAVSRANQLHWTTSSEQYVLTIFDQDHGVFDRKARILCETLRGKLPRSRWVNFDNKLVFFLPHALNDPSALLNDLQVNGLRAALSAEFDSLLKLRSAYDQTLRAFELGSRLHPEQRLYRYEDYVLHHLGQVLNQQSMRGMFSHPAIQRIAQYDREHKTELLPTLYAYLRYVDQPAEAAASLFIHKNTLFYRINRLRELFGLDLNNGTERARLLMTLAFREI